MENSQREVKVLSTFVKDERTHYVCQCYCGKEFTTRAHNLKSGRTRSCGCYQREVARKHGQKTIHGMYRSPEHKSWRSMLMRCYNPKNPSYSRYGAAGITVCDEWRTFPGFYRDMGDKPFPNAQLDRINTGGNYEPGNCRWVTAKENANNRTDNMFIEHEGLKLSYSQWAERIGMNKNTLISRIRDGWDPVKALTTPLKRPFYGRKS